MGCQLRLKDLMCNEELESLPEFEYELLLIDYGFFKHSEYFRINNVIKIAEEAIFDPKKLELPTDTDCVDKNDEIVMHVPEEGIFDLTKFTLEHDHKKKINKKFYLSVQ